MIHRIRFDPPRAYNLRVESPLAVRIEFVTPAFDGEPEHSITVPTLREACDHVSMVIDTFTML
ncbi:MAG: hypothetical protein ACLP01_05895 [Solirubrobacteraceae bacterium]